MPNFRAVGQQFLKLHEYLTVNHMVETKNKTLRNRNVHNILTIYQHTKITFEEILDKKYNLH
jgi:hypothetical protein